MIGNETIDDDNKNDSSSSSAVAAAVPGIYLPFFVADYLTYHSIHQKIFRDDNIASVCLRPLKNNNIKNKKKRHKTGIYSTT